MGDAGAASTISETEPGPSKENIQWRRHRRPERRLICYAVASTPAAGKQPEVLAFPERFRLGQPCWKILFDMGFHIMNGKGFCLAYGRGPLIPVVARRSSCTGSGHLGAFATAPQRIPRRVPWPGAGICCFSTCNPLAKPAPLVRQPVLSSQTQQHRWGGDGMAGARRGGQVPAGAGWTETFRPAKPFAYVYVWTCCRTCGGAAVAVEAIAQTDPWSGHKRCCCCQSGRFR